MRLAYSHISWGAAGQGVQSPLRPLMVHQASFTALDVADSCHTTKNTWPTCALDCAPLAWSQRSAWPPGPWRPLGWAPAEWQCPCPHPLPPGEP